MEKEEIDYKLAAEQLRTGKPLFGRGGALAPMLERILNAALEGEMDAHLSEECRESGNHPQSATRSHHPLFRHIDEWLLQILPALSSSSPAHCHR